VEYIDKGAEISPDGIYRYRLWRKWKRDNRIAFFGKLVIVMLNPSTADGLEDDPTIRKCVGFADRNGYDEIMVLNLFAFRATDPRALTRFDGSIIGTENYDRFDSEIPGRDVLCAWGGEVAKKRLAFGAAVGVERVLAAEPRRTFCLGKTAAGIPRHPLMLAYTQPLVPIFARLG